MCFLPYVYLPVGNISFTFDCGTISSVTLFVRLHLGLIVWFYGVCYSLSPLWRNPLFVSSFYYGVCVKLFGTVLHTADSDGFTAHLHVYLRNMTRFRLSCVLFAGSTCGSGTQVLEGRSLWLGVSTAAK